MGNGDDHSWYVAANGQTYGPFAWGELIDQVRAGKVVPATPLWRMGFADWINAGDFPGIFSPPPPPSEMQVSPPPVPVHSRAVAPSTTLHDVDEDEPARSPKPEKGRAWYFEIWLAPHDAREALERIKIGAYAGYAFAISYALGAIMFFFGGNPSGPKLATADDYFWSGVVGVFAALIIGALAALSQRRPGVVIPAGLLLWFTLEVLAKIGSGKTNAGWLVAYYAIGVSFVAAIRGARFLRKKSPEWRQSA